MILFAVILKYRCQLFSLGIFKREYVKHSTTKTVSKYVFVSEDTNIFSNLAIEEWLYQNYDFSARQILLLWRNTPAVVIGRHQNPWLEANVKLKTRFATTIARRNSGGGTVYHDLENLNLSFLTSREEYNRVHNLETITRSLKNEWNIECEVNARDDIVFNNFKVSGTASKLSRKNSYHHCTLLVDANKTAMSSLLRTHDRNIVTNATRSKPSPVMNLRDLNSSINVDRLISVIGQEFLRTPTFMKLVRDDVTIESKGFHFVTAEEIHFPGISEKIKQFQSWDWIFGRTPKFKKTICIPTCSLAEEFFSSDPVDVQVEVESAVIKNITISVPPEFLVFVIGSILRDLTVQFLGKRYSEELVDDVEETVSNFFRSKLSDPRLYCIS